ncbi:hypothetical protein MKX01_011344 [Papaver californicum]|nr:hypothetical protein MKX01_011344 [Papaver californicum]
MAMFWRFSSKLAHISKVLQTDALVTRRPALQQTSEVLRNYATATGTKEAKVRVPLALFGGSGNYASALYIAAAKANAVEKVEAELLDLADASARSPVFSQFTQDLSVPRDTRLKAIEAITAEAKFTDITKNFLSVLAHNGRLRHIDTITKRFVELTMAHKGEVSAIVTTVIPLPADEEKQLKETLQEIIGQGKKVKLTQKIDPSILGGLVVEFSQKVFDMSIRTRARQMERFLRDPIDTL